MVFKNRSNNRAIRSLIAPVFLETARFSPPFINHLGKRRAETAKMPIEFDLSFTGLETAPFRPRGQKQRVYSLGINPYSRSPNTAPYFVVLKHGE